MDRSRQAEGHDTLRRNKCRLASFYGPSGHASACAQACTHGRPSSASEESSKPAADGGADSSGFRGLLTLARPSETHDVATNRVT